jgi:hypothetical protein
MTNDGKVVALEQHNQSAPFLLSLSQRERIKVRDCSMRFARAPSKSLLGRCRALANLVIPETEHGNPLFI